MDANLFVTFCVFAILIIVIPGPNVLVIVSTSIAAGKTRGLQTVLGTSTAMAIQLFVTALGTGWLISFISDGLIWIKWIGVGYLLFLGITTLNHFFNPFLPPSYPLTLSPTLYPSLPSSIPFLPSFLLPSPFSLPPFINPSFLLLYCPLTIFDTLSLPSPSPLSTIGVAAPFTSRTPSVRAVVDLIRQGKE